MNNKISKKYNSYPPHIKKELIKIRKLILDIAAKHDSIDLCSEELKWGELSFVTQSSGSTIRIDWKEKNPDSISLFFNCNTKLISWFKEIYPDDFDYYGNREIRLPLNKIIPQKKLEKCIELALKYHLLKSFDTNFIP